MKDKEARRAGDQCALYPMRTIVIHATVLTVNQTNQVIYDGAIAFENGVLTHVGQMPDKLDTYDEVIDAKGRIVMPGLVNTHGHTAMSLLRGYADDLPLQEWLETKMWPLEAQFTEDHVRWGTSLSIIEMLKTGTTTFVDMYDHMDMVAELVTASGMRARLCRGVIGLCSAEEQTKKLEEASAFAAKWNETANGRIMTMMSPHGAYTCPPDYVERIVARAHELDLPVHIHMSETEWEVQQNVADYGARPVAHLEKLGVFNRPTLVAHAVHLTDEELDILARYDVKVSHNPISNLKLGSGIARVPDMMERGICVSLGTDSSASNNNLDLFEEMRMVALLHKGHRQNPVLVPASEALRMATIYGAEAIFMDEQIGSLEVGKQADFIMLNSHDVYFQPANDPISHVVYSASGRDVTDVYVQGVQLVKDGKCLTMEEETVIENANRMFELLEKK
ncbi:amidohydrolase family protein [Aneurinibacillus migulanus]|uniref:5-methylthioadenosine/S-adenosylhomocysteine deaminase n=2 Tax=Aneurinibacillus migulanus TaxID=47500 RepID=A0A0K2WEX4_ANEMI|nr:amidohydrolase [Aneurinibacillus migulanus]MCP1354126.1 amidohydrolase [Aneurinibacillus migulanus]MED0891213.1 amidohydrolase [Aneurinibacillus migulanus]MED1614099.1 amidohydrolase [Aneurinibacillus migulanus]MED4728077.1 amidohydrolase [Aneurinibacillus migulanus]CEH30056.1 5-methylthioadenosine/S-adenosylhomocysteine deam inase (MTA/SAH deaminase) [Aneurinibacillus migulanus]